MSFKNAIENQVQDILTSHGVFDYEIKFLWKSKKIHVIINQDKTAEISWENYQGPNVRSSDEKWIHNLSSKINEKLATCNCVWVICIASPHKFEDLNFSNVNLKIKEKFTSVINGFSCYANSVNIDLFQQKNQGKIEVCSKDGVAKINANNNTQSVGSFISRLGGENSSRKSGTKNPAFPIPSDIYAIIMDTGILRSHPDLKSKINSNFSRNYSSINRANWNDDNGHGTHVAGIIGAQDNNLGIVGVSPDVNLIAIKILNKQGFGSYSNIIAGLDYISKWKTENPTLKGVVNMSLGGSPFSALDTSIQNLINNFGITVVVAAGNESSDAGLYSPSRTPEAITVGAYDHRDNRLANFSNYGKLVDILAPGVSIDSCFLNNGYTILSGTSMATPVVVGAVIDVLANPKFSNLTPSQIRDKIVNDASVSNPVCYNGKIGTNKVIILSKIASNFGTTDKSVYIGSY